MFSKKLEEKIEKFFETYKKKAKIYNEYDNDLSLPEKIFKYGYIPMFIISIGLYVIMLYKPKIVENHDFIIVIFNILAVIYYHLQIFRNWGYFIVKNEGCFTILKFRNFIVVGLMMFFFIIYSSGLNYIPKGTRSLLFTSFLPQISLICFLLQFLYNKTFSKFDDFFIILLISAILTPYGSLALGTKTSFLYKGLILAITGVFVILSTIFDYKRPEVSKKEKTQIIFIIVSIIIIIYDALYYEKIFKTSSVPNIPRIF